MVAKVANIMDGMLGSSQSTFAAVATAVYLVLACASGAGALCVLDAVIRGSLYVYAINCMAAGRCSEISWLFAVLVALSCFADGVLILYARSRGTAVKDRYAVALNSVVQAPIGSTTSTFDTRAGNATSNAHIPVTGWA